jgi:hypothetical protein
MSARGTPISACKRYASSTACNLHFPRRCFRLALKLGDTLLEFSRAHHGADDGSERCVDRIGLVEAQALVDGQYRETRGHHHADVINIILLRHGDPLRPQATFVSVAAAPARTWVKLKERSQRNALLFV